MTVFLDLYYKDDCDLCVNMETLLTKFIVDSNNGDWLKLRMHDIEESSAMFERYREYIPVLALGEEEICHYFLDIEELQTALSKLTR